jgi:hypothetical protein
MEILIYIIYIDIHVGISYIFPFLGILHQ